MKRHAKEVDGVSYVNTHSGQKRAYGNSFYEYDITSDLPASEVELVCREKIRTAIPEAEWLADYRAPGGCSMEKAFRPHYKFKATGEGRYSYSVRMLYTD